MMDWLQLRSICAFMQSNDKNGEFDQLFDDYMNDELGYDAVLECLQMSLQNWILDIHPSSVDISDVQAMKYYVLVTKAKEELNK